MATVKFISRKEMEHCVIPDRDTDIISITDPGADKAHFSDDSFHSVLRLCFDDVYDQGGILPDEDPRGILWHSVYVFFDTLHARKIIEFIRASTAKHLIVHCNAGISRSSAVAAFAADKYNYELSFGKYDTSGANPRVSRLLNKVYNGEELKVFEYEDGLDDAIKVLAGAI